MRPTLTASLAFTPASNQVAGVLAGAYQVATPTATFFLKPLTFGGFLYFRPARPF
jgi:hypothetical protein